MVLGTDRKKVRHSIPCVPPVERVLAEIEGFFNLIYSHLMALYEPDSPELQSAVSKILQIISSSPSEHTAIKYRMYALVESP